MVTDRFQENDEFTLLKRDVEYIYETFKAASEALLEIYRSESEWELSYKSDHSPVTKADTTSSTIITKRLRSEYPNILIVSEEEEIPSYEVRKNCRNLWLVDPLDGTKEFIHKTGEFTINLALVRDHHVVAGFIFVPTTNSFYYAIKGQGSFEWNGKSEGIKLQVSTFDFQSEGIRVLASRQGMDHHSKKYIESLKSPIISSRGSALKFIALAKGEADYYPRMIHIMEWDTAAGQIIIEEAGGKLVDAHTNLPLVYNKTSLTNPYFIAMGNAIHEKEE